MVLPAPAGVLYALLQIPEVYTFVQERSNHIFNRRSSVPAPMFNSWRVPLPLCHALATVTWPYALGVLCIVMIGSSSSLLKYLAFTARKIFSRYPAVRLVLTFSFIFLSSLSKFQSLIREGLKISFRPRLPKKPRVNCVKKPWNKMIPYKFYASKVLDSISTGLKIPEGQTKKNRCTAHFIQSAHLFP